jgi:hypothetical protein
MEPKVVRLDDLPAIAGPGSLTWRPVRLTLGIQAFGCNAYTAGEPGQDVVEPHTEDPRRTAIELRPEAAEWARDDEDLESLRDDPELRALAALP